MESKKIKLLSVRVPISGRLIFSPYRFTDIIDESTIVF